MRPVSGVPVITGQRVLLRPPAKSDRDAWCDLRRANWNFLRRAEPTPQPGNDPNGAAAFDRMLASAHTERTVRFLVCLREGGQVVGQVTFSDISRGCFQSCFVGYWIGRAYSGRGLMSEALALAIVYAFSTLKLHRVEANIAPSNRRSLAVAKRCGLRYEGRARGLLHLDGRWRDHERWAVINRQ
jgi:ribosomal-protein-alanine N-acetyltransferase